MEICKEELTRYIEHTLLKPEATPDEIRELCREAVEHGFRSVCVSSSFVALCKECLVGASVRICSVAGFPLGNASSEAKVAEAQQAIADGADEVDMVLHVGRLKAGDRNYVRCDIVVVTEAAHSRGAKVKVIIEAALLTEDEKRTACILCLEAGVDYVKTSTGYSKGGATLDDVRLMKGIVGTRVGIKAAGGVRTLEATLAMIDAGATCIGTSSGVAIINGIAAAS
jgi:deoxyribose-phosphate aldolase